MQRAPRGNTSDVEPAQRRARRRPSSATSLLELVDETAEYPVDVDRVHDLLADLLVRYYHRHGPGLQT